MNTRMLLGALALLAFSSTTLAGDVYVQGHYRKDGTYVPGHYRSSPNSTRSDNYGVGNKSQRKQAYGNPHGLQQRDQDNDGLSNQYDLDDDNDGLMDDFDN